MDLDIFDAFDTAGSSNDNSVKRQKREEKPDDVIIEGAIEPTNNDDEEDMKDDIDDNGEDVNDEDEENLVLAAPMTKVTVHELETEGGCLHEVVCPEDLDYVPLRDFSQNEGYKPAKVFPFKLDPFQREAVMCIENNQSVLVSAHTSAGKTVVAEYAIAASLRDHQRVIYTTPIKALSNQKYREFFEEFRDVGLITGDVTINPSASCLIMTTEILRLMLFRGSEIMREVGWVIFDEIHYMRDKERGVVWEETIILLPDNVHHVFLSATIPNARQFAEWISHLHHQVCHVVYTDFRPVPLQHYIFPAGGDGLHLVVDEQGTFRDDNFNQAMSILQSAGDAAKGDFANKNRKGQLKEQSNCFKIIRTITERELCPVIVFSFSKKECEAYALQMTRLDFNTNEEKLLVEEVFNNAIDVLSEDDKKLPQVEHVLPLLKRGIGIHHSGLLPIIKETIEILFGEGLIKALFATETFAMGLNMPARTVVFTNARKFDGTDFRWITSGEYIQMSGRAGRRGLDDKGIVVLMIDEKMSAAVGKDLIKGKPDPINSAFHLTYNMVLNLMRVEDVNPEYMLQHSFYQFQHYAEVPHLTERLHLMKIQHDQIKVKDESKVNDYFQIKTLLAEMSENFLEFIRKPNYILPFLQPGRIMKFTSDDGYDLQWGVVIDFQKKPMKRRGPTDEGFLIIVDAMLFVEKNSDKTGLFRLPANEKDGEMKLISMTLKNIAAVSSARIYVPQDLKSYESRQSVRRSIKAVLSEFKNKVPLLDPIEDMKIKDNDFKILISKIESNEKRLIECGDIDSQSLELFTEKQRIADKMKNVKTQLRKAQSLLQMDELKARKRVLRRLGYCSPTDVIETKGRVACEITSGDELLITEMLFNGLFNDLHPFQINALLSCFVFEEKTETMPKLGEELAQPLRRMQELAKRIASVSNEAKLLLDEQDYVGSFKINMMDVIYAWSKGATFCQLCKMTDAFEGSIIRCMRRLEELLRQMCQAAKVIGNTDLENRFAEADKVIKRDIVFAASLYL